MAGYKLGNPGCCPCGSGVSCVVNLTSFGCGLSHTIGLHIPSIPVTFTGPGGATVSGTTNSAGLLTVSLPALGSWTAVGTYPAPFAPTATTTFTAYAGTNTVGLQPTAGSGYICSGFDIWPWPARDITVSDPLFGTSTIFYTPPRTGAFPYPWPSWAGPRPYDFAGNIISPDVWMLTTGSSGTPPCANPGWQHWPWGYFASELVGTTIGTGGGFSIGGFIYDCSYFDPNYSGGGTNVVYTPAPPTGTYSPFALTFVFNINGIYNSGYIYNGTGTVTLT